MKCHNCNAKHLAADPIRGLVYCTKCGVVQEENAIVSSLDFSEEKGASKLTGQIIQITETFTKVGKSFIQTTSFYIENKIQNICSGLGLGNEHACAAFRWYKLALQYNVSKGKNILYTLSACIYIVCRQEKTPHMLIDFSALLRIDVHRIGRVFLRILNCLGIKTALIDPSLYLPRFVTKLGIQDVKILETSIRLVGRMKRDWIVVGRRPNNLCGAALLVACRIFGEERSVEEIARIVNVSTITINKRLKELCDTESADLSVEEFFNVWLKREEDPPIVKNRKLSREIEKIFIDKMGSPGCSDFLGTPSGEDCSLESGRCEFDENALETTSGEHPGDTASWVRAIQARKCGHHYESMALAEDALGIDDKEIDELLLSKDETEKREKIWNEMYGEYMAQRESRAIVQRKHRGRKQRRRFNNFSDALQNCIREKKLTKKINFEAIKRLFE